MAGGQGSEEASASGNKQKKPVFSQIPLGMWHPAGPNPGLFGDKIWFCFFLKPQGHVPPLALAWILSLLFISCLEVSL